MYTMEDLLKAVIQSIRKSDDVEMLLLKWGRVFLYDTGIDFCASKDTLTEEIILLFKQHEVTYRDVAKLDLVSVMSNHRSLDWQSFELQNKGGFVLDSSQFCSILRKSLLKVGYYDIATKRSDDLSTWIRISKPESISAAYFIYFSESQTLLCAGCKNLKTIVLEAVKTSICASHAFSVEPPVKSYKVTTTRTIMKPVSRHTTRRKSGSTRKKPPSRSPGYRFVHHVVPRPLRHSAFDTFSSLRVRGMDQSPPIWIRGRIELFGVDILKGLCDMRMHNLADLPPENLIKAVKDQDEGTEFFVS